MPKYRTKPVKPMTIEAVSCSPLLASPGHDWLITEPTGIQYFVSDQEFRERFELVEGSRKRAAVEGVLKRGATAIAEAE